MANRKWFLSRTFLQERQQKEFRSYRGKLGDKVAGNADIKTGVAPAQRIDSRCPRQQRPRDVKKNKQN